MNKAPGISSYWKKRQQANHTIKTLTPDNLDTITDTRDISETYSFYKILYTADLIDLSAQQETLNKHTTPSLPEKELLLCDNPLSEPERHKALLSMESSKSPGIDGLTTNFYKNFWNIIGVELKKVYN